MTVFSDRWVNSWTAPLLRVVIIALATGLGLVGIYVAPALGWSGDAGYGLTALLLTMLPLLGVAALASMRPTNPEIRRLQPIAEALAIGAVIGSSQTLGGPGGLYGSVLVVAVFMAGQRSGLIGALTATALGVAPLLAATLSSLPRVPEEEEQAVYAALLNMLTLGGGLLGTGVISAWVRRLLQDSRPADDTSAYTDAFRLLSELQHVARNLSLGLDPVTLATALVDDLRTMAPDSRVALAIRGPEGRFAPLVGHLDNADHAVASQAWLSTDVGSRDSDGEHRLALPVLMGDRVIAVATIGGDQLREPELRKAEDLVRHAGPRLAAALLFDEVRQLATVDERLRLAREIHDGIAQELASLGYLLDDLAERVPADAVAEVHTLRDHVRKVTGELRLSIFDLRAGIDDEVTLGAALSEHVQRMAAASRLIVHTTIDEQGDRLPTGSEIELLRIAQEALTNVRKHARATTVWIDCVVDAPDMLLRIADDGIGLQPSRPGSMGLRGMRERAARIGGTLSVGARDGGGTSVEVRFGDPALATPQLRASSAQG